MKLRVRGLTLPYGDGKTAVSRNYSFLYAAWKLLREKLFHARAEGLGSSVGIPNRYGLDGPGIESRWEARYSAPVQTGTGANPASYAMGTDFILCFADRASQYNLSN